MPARYPEETGPRCHVCWKLTPTPGSHYKAKTKHRHVDRCTCCTAETECSPNVGLMLGHRLRRWPRVTPSLSKVSGCLCRWYISVGGSWVAVFFKPRVIDAPFFSSLWDLDITILVHSIYRAEGNYPANTKHLYDICTVSAQRQNCQLAGTGKQDERLTLNVSCYYCLPLQGQKL